MKERLASASVVGVVALLGCGEGGGGNDSGALLDSLLAETQTRSVSWCACWQELLYGSHDKCLEDAERVDPERVTCAKEALAQNEEGSRRGLRCMLDAERRFTTCMETELNCSRSDFGLQSCLERYSDDSSTCGDVPPEVVEGFSQCGLDLGETASCATSACSVATWRASAAVIGGRFERD